AGRARVYAADALGKLRGQERPAARALVAALDDPELDVRRTATMALGKIGWAVREEVFPGLVKATRDKERDVRMTAAESLRRLGKPALGGASAPQARRSPRGPGPTGRAH